MPFGPAGCLATLLRIPEVCHGEMSQGAHESFKAAVQILESWTAWQWWMTPDNLGGCRLWWSVMESQHVQIIAAGTSKTLCLSKAMNLKFWMTFESIWSHGFCSLPCTFSAVHLVLGRIWGPMATMSQRCWCKRYAVWCGMWYMMYVSPLHPKRF